MKRLLVGLLVAVFVLGVSTQAYAKDMKIGFVDLRRVFFEYRKTGELDKELQDKDKIRKEERDKKVENIRKLKDEIELLSVKAKEKKQTLLEEKIKELDTFDRQYRDEMFRKKDDMFREVMKSISKAVEDYAKANDYDIIYDSRTLLYGSEDMDLTDKVLEVLNK